MKFTANRKAIAVGAIAGMRSAAAVAVASQCLARKRYRKGRWALLASPTLSTLITAAAAAEFIADKVLKTPRTAPTPLAARITSGALSGAALCAAEGSAAGRGAVLGAVSAMAGAFGLKHLRHRLARGAGVPQQLMGLAEDAAVVALGRKVLKH